ncbi:MAG: hypothetical protein ACREJ0_02090, partial [Geminicoccaceae bacterium]
MAVWLTEAFVRAPRSLDPVLRGARRHLVPFLQRTLPAMRLLGRTTAGQAVSVLLVDRRFTAARLCRCLFVGEPVLDWSGNVPLAGLGGFLARHRAHVDLVLATIPRRLPPFLRPASGITVPGFVELVLPVMANREAQLRLAHSKRRNRLRACERGGFGWRVSEARKDFDEFVSNFHVPHVTRRFGSEVVLRGQFILERHARFGGVLWLTHDGRTIGGDLFRQDLDVLWLLATGMVGDPPATRPSPQEALSLFATDLARERGCTSVSFGAAAPVLRDGMLSFKLSLGTRVVDYADSHRDLIVDWAQPSAALHALLREYPLIVRRGRGFAALTSTVGVDAADQLTFAAKFVPAG